MFDRGLAQYLRKIYAFPLVTAEEEGALARRCRDRDDRDAAQKLVTSHLRLVAKVARCYLGYGLPLSDLISEGSVGLMQAVQRFDPERGYRLSTYAIWWIHASMREHVLHSSSLVKIGTTPAQKKLFFNLAKLKRRLQATHEGGLSPNEVKWIAAELNVSEGDVSEMSQRMVGPDESLNDPTGGDRSADHVTERIDLLADEAPDPETLVAERKEIKRRRRLVCIAFDTLSFRERDVIYQRRLKEEHTTLGELGLRYGLSREGVRLIECRAMDKLRIAVGRTPPDRAIGMSVSAALGHERPSSAIWSLPPGQLRLAMETPAIP
jgi:RNA polymerase sigma-32 factor